MEKDIAKRNLIVTKNQGLVGKWAKEYSGTNEARFKELEAMGFLGLIKAADNFDETKGVKFSTYAASWIKGEIFRGVGSELQTIRIAETMNQRVLKLKKAQHEWEMMYGEEPSVEKLAEYTGLSQKEVENALNITCNVLSLDDTTSEEGDMVWRDIISDEGAADPQLLAEQEDLREKIGMVLDGLPQRESQVLRLRYGFDGEEKTLAEVGKIMGITKERVRQIEANALNRIRKNSSMMMSLEEYECA